jgi:hypothetical protein
MKVERRFIKRTFFIWLTFYFSSRAQARRPLEMGPENYESHKGG